MEHSSFDQRKFSRVRAVQDGYTIFKPSLHFTFFQLKSLKAIQVLCSSTCRYDLSAGLHMPTRCKFKTTENYRKARQVSKYKFF
jgi:hypothetical protein